MILLVDEQVEKTVVAAPFQGPVAVAIMAMTLLLATFNPALVGIMLAGALLMVLIGLFTMDEVYGTIEWRSIFLVGQACSLSAWRSTTVARRLSLADRLVTWLNPYGPVALLAGLVILTALLTQVINGAAVVGIMTPIVIEAVRELAWTRGAGHGRGLGQLAGLHDAAGYAVNVLVMGPAGYRFHDFLRSARR